MPRRSREPRSRLNRAPNARQPVGHLAHKHPPPLQDDGTRPRAGAGRAHSGLILANRTTLAHFSISSAMSLPNSVGVIGIGSAPRLAIWAFILASASPALISLLSRSMISVGVPLGAPKPCHPVAS